MAPQERQFIHTRPGWPAAQPPARALHSLQQEEAPAAKQGAGASQWPAVVGRRSGPSDLVAPDDEHRCCSAQDAAAHRDDGVEQLLLPGLGLCAGCGGVGQGATV